MNVNKPIITGTIFADFAKITIGALTPLVSANPVNTVASNCAAPVLAIRYEGNAFVRLVEPVITIITKPETVQLTSPSIACSNQSLSKCVPALVLEFSKSSRIMPYKRKKK